MVSVSQTIDFRHVGERPNSYFSPEEVKNRVPIGIRTPMRMGQDGEIFAMNKNIAEEIKQNFRNLLQTNWGERPGRFFFGANLKEMNFEYSSGEQFDEEVAVRIKSATSRWMPYVVLRTLERFVESQETDKVGKVRLRIMYDVPMAKLKNQLIDVIFYIGG